MLNQFSRTEILLGNNTMERLKNARVAIFGVGGVGGFAVEALARSGIGTLDLIDNDIVSLTNLNRQIIALHSTIGLKKVEVAKKVIVGRKIEDQDLQQELYLKAIETPLRGETKEEQEEEQDL